jgi:hypothetical protein
MAQLNQTLLHKVAKRLGKTPQYIREQASRRASREGVASPVALVMWARELGIGVASALDKLAPQFQQQLSVPRVAVPTTSRARRAPPAPRRSAARSGRASDGKLVFISHGSEDRRLAGALVDLLRSALNLTADKILCTSVDGYKLQGGRHVDAALRDAVVAAKTLVGIISPTSRESTYVQMELGARWGARKHMIPVTAGGVSPGEVRGPVGQLNALDLSSRAGVLQLIGDLSTELKVESERPEVFDDHVNRVVRASRASARPRPRHRRR